MRHKLNKLLLNLLYKKNWNDFAFKGGEKVMFRMHTSLRAIPGTVYAKTSGGFGLSFWGGCCGSDTPERFVYDVKLKK